MQVDKKKRKFCIIVTILLIIGINGISLGNITPVSDRTPEVRDAIIAAIPEANTAADVTDAHLSTITELNLRGLGISNLKTGDFSGLTALTNLNLYGNDLSNLPNGFFSGITSLTTLRLGRNIFDPMPLIVLLDEVGQDQFKVVIPTGAPFDVTFPINVTTDGVSSVTMNITLPIGDIESELFTITTTEGTTDNQIVEIGTLPTLPRNHYGYAFARSNACNRTLQVRNAIVAAVPGVDDCRNVTDAHLSAIHTLILSNTGTTKLKSGDFSGLSSLRTLYLDRNQLTSLPEDVFSGLSNLRNLYINTNQLNDLPAEVFSGLTSLRQINIHSNRLTTLPKTLFSGLGSLTQIFVHNNRLTTLDPDIFSDVSTLKYLYLNNNRLTTLPENLFSNITLLEHLLLHSNRFSNIPSGLFKGFSSPILLWIHGNPVQPLPLTITLEMVSEGEFKVVVPAGAPIDINLSFSVTNGSITDGTNSITIPVGSVESDTIAVTRATNTSDDVTVDIDILSVLPTFHLGYSLTKSADLPLEIISRTNTAPVFTEGETTTRTVSENTASNSNIGTPVTATDADNDTLTYILSGVDAASFTIDTATGQLKTKATLDYETKDAYTVTIIVSDEKLTDSINVTIDITDIDETVPNRAPVFTEGDTTTRTVAEKTLEGVEIGSPVSATDLDNDTLTYMLGGADAAIFDIESTTGQLKTKKTLDFESQFTYKVTLTVSDSKLSDTIDVTITVTDIDETIPNRAPTFTNGDSTTRTVAENTVANVNIGTAITATDPDGNTLTYTLRGTDGASFAIETATGQLKTKAILNYEAKNSYTVTVTVSDGSLTDTIECTVNITNVNEAPTFTDSESATRTVAENTDVGTNVGTTITATDIDSNDLTYTLGGPDATSFDIEDTTGQLKTNSTFDYESKSTYTVTITVSDGALTDLITVTVNVSNVNEAPVFTEGDSTTRTVAEQTLEGVEIGTPVSATDPDSDTLFYTLGDADAGIFDIESTTGQLKTEKTLDFETQSTYQVTLTVSDSKLTDSIDVTITVTNIDETIPNRAPTFTDGDNTTRSVAENSDAGTDIGTAIVATDPDGNTLIYTLGGTDATSFEIEDATGQLRTKSALDYETKNSYTVTVTVSDGNGGSDSITVTIAITDVDETPPVHTPIGVCDRTPQVRDAIVTAVAVNSCEEVTETHLALISSLYLADEAIASLKDGDFDGLSSLERLNLNNNQLTSLPEDIFDGLSSLEFLSLRDNQLSSLSEDIFDGLSSLDHLRLFGNQLTSLPADLFDGLSSLNELHLNSNQLTSLPEDIFDGLSSLTYLTISSNQLTSIPAKVFKDLSSLEILPLFINQLTNIEAGTFEGLSSIKTLFLNLNPGSPFGFTISLEKVGTNQFKAIMPVGATFSVVIPLSVTNGSINDDITSVTIPVGSVESSLFTVTRTAGTTNAVTVDIGTLPSLPSDHTGYSLVKSNELPLTVIGETGTSNVAPVFTDGTSTSRTIAENSATGTNIGTAVTATDADNDTLTYTLSGTDAASFDIENTTGQLKTRAALDYETENSYTVTVTVSDGSFRDTITVTINVTDITETPSNSAPVFTDGTSTSRTIAENSAADTNIGTAIAATDADDDTLTYTLSGTDAASFDIESTTGQLKTKAILNHESKSSYSVTVTASDNTLTDTIDVTITISDVNEVPVFTDGNETTRMILENTDSGASIGTPISATDEDNDTLTYALGGTDASSFGIDTATGQLKTSTALNHETKDTYSVTVSVADADATIVISVTITVTDKKEAPVFTDGETTTRSVDENTSAGENIGIPVAATDEDNDTLEYALSGTDVSSFSIDTSTGQLKTSAALDYETTSSYSVTVSVTDNKGGTDSISVTISVTDVDEESTTPTFTPVCDRTPQVRDAIVAAAGVHDCSDVTEEHLASISILDLSSKGITSLKAGDFDGLSSLLQLDLDTNDLSSLPSDIFDELTKLNKLRMGGNNLSSLPSGLFDNLTSLTELRLSSNNLVSLPENLFDDNTALTKLNLGHNKLSSLPSGLFDKLTALTELPMSANSLSSLPSGIFDKLTSLTFLNLGNNDFSSLPSGIFDELTALTSLHLHVNKFSSLPSDIFDELTSLTKLSLFHNDFSSLPSDIFDELTSLTKLSLFHNDFSSLPTGLFDGLTSLTTLELNYNTVNPLPLTVSLEKVSDGQFKAVAPIGAPFDIVLPLTVSNGSISGGTTSVTIPIGKVESDTLTVTRTSGTTATVTVDIGTLPSIPSSHNGYSLVKSTDLPLEVISAVSGAPTTVGNDTPQIPVATALLSNYPNPFNPETWIPYQLSNPADVSLTIYDIRGVVVRQLTLGRQSASFYLSRSRAIHWDGRNALGEKVATGLYFYVFKADDYSAKRKMLIRK